MLRKSLFDTSPLIPYSYNRTVCNSINKDIIDKNQSKHELHLFSTPLYITCSVTVDAKIETFGREAAAVIEIIRVFSLLTTIELHCFHYIENRDIYWLIHPLQRSFHSLLVPADKWVVCKTVWNFNEFVTYPLPTISRIGLWTCIFTGYGHLRCLFIFLQLYITMYLVLFFLIILFVCLNIYI